MSAFETCKNNYKHQTVESCDSIATAQLMTNDATGEVVEKNRLDAQDEQVRLRPLAGEFPNNICRTKENIKDLKNPNFLEHDPNQYKFCEKLNPETGKKDYFVRHPPLTQPQNIDRLVSKGALLQAELNKLKELKGKNIDVEKKIHDEGVKYWGTALKGGVAGMIAGAIAFGYALQKFNTTGKGAYLSGYNRELAQKWMKVKQAQSLIDPDTDPSKSDKCREFVESMNRLKRKALLESLVHVGLLVSDLVILGLTVTLPLLDYASSKPTSKIRREAEIDPQIQQLLNRMKESEINERSRLNSQDPEVVREIRIDLGEKAEKVKEKMQKEEELSVDLNNSLKELESSYWQSIKHGTIFVGGTAATAVTFAIFVPLLHFFSEIKPLRGILAGARGFRALRKTLQDWQDLELEAREEVVIKYAKACQEEKVSSEQKSAQVETTRQSLVPGVPIPAAASVEQKKLFALKQKIESLSQPRPFLSFRPHLSFERKQELDHEIEFVETYIRQGAAPTVEEGLKRIEALIEVYSTEATVEDKFKAGFIFLTSTLGVTALLGIGGAAGAGNAASGGVAGSGGTAVTTQTASWLGGVPANGNALAAAAAFLVSLFKFKDSEKHL